MDPKNYKSLLNKKNVVAVAKGQKWTNGQNTKEEALLVFVEKKVPKGQLKASDVIPDKIDGHTTDVVGKTGAIKAQALTSRVRPVPGGFSCGHLWVTAGTLGGWFTDSEGDLVGLSNNHVLAAENRAMKAGAPWRGRQHPGHLTVQPGRYDQRNWRSNRIGFLKDFVKLVRNDNNQDSAIMKVYNPELVNPEIHTIGQPVGFNDNLQVGDAVQKTGRTTGYTTSQVIATDGVVHVQYSRHLGVLEFEDQIITNYMSAGGDSGSLVLDMGKNIVGLLFAGSNSISIHNKIKYPRDQWGLQIYNPNPIAESYSHTLTIDGVDEVVNQLGDMNALVERARSEAKGGANVSLSISFTASP